MTTIARVWLDSTLVIWMILSAAPSSPAEHGSPRPDVEALSSVWTPGADRGFTTRPNRPVLGLLLVDGYGLQHDVGEALTAEVRRLLRQTDVDIRILVSGLPVADIPEPAFPVVRVRIWPRNGSFLQADTSAMGIVRVGRGGVVESVHVFVPVIHAAMLSGRETLDDLSARETGRALARVIAHELVHAMTPETPHARFGLMQPAMSREFLRGLRLTPLDRRSATAFARELTVRRQVAAAQ